MALTVEQIIQVQCLDLYNDPSLQTWIQLSTELTVSCLGSLRNTGIALRACHMYTLSERTGGDAGSVSGKKEGKLSISYSSSAPAGADGDLSQTNYGRQLMALHKRKCGPGVMVLGC